MSSVPGGAGDGVMARTRLPAAARLSNFALFSRAIASSPRMDAGDQHEHGRVTARRAWNGDHSAKMNGAFGAEYDRSAGSVEEFVVLSS